jgi:hypothetical protein
MARLTFVEVQAEMDPARKMVDLMKRDGALPADASIKRIIRYVGDIALGEEGAKC